MSRAPITLFAASAVALATAGCAQEQQLRVTDAWVRLAAVKGRPAAVYFTVHGGPADATLVGVSTEVAVRTEMHESMRAANGGMTMDAIRAVPVPALQSVRFTPGGRHAMLFDVNPAVQPGGIVTFVFTFADATRIEQTARVIAAGDPAPK